MTEITERFVDSGDGVRIAVYEEGNPDGPTVVLVHGWPDSHVLWDGVVPLLADRFRIIALRQPRRRVNRLCPSRFRRTRWPRYADDFAAVIDAVAPGEPVHVLAHDWGSAGVWEYLARSGRERPRRLVHLGVGPERRSHEPLRHRQPASARTVRGGFSQALDQLLRFSYMGLFSIPVLAPLLVRAVPRRRTHAHAVRRDGIPADQIHHSDDLQVRRRQQLEGLPGQLLPHDRPPHRTDHYVDVPVQLIVNTRDPLCAAARLRRHPQLGAAAVAPRHQGRPLGADVAPAGARATRSPSSSTSWTASRRAGRCCARRSAASANTSATRWCR